MPQAAGLGAREGANMIDSKRRVVVIDDSDIARDLISMILEEHGFEVAAHDSPFGLGPSLKRFDPHLVLLDLRMPGVTEENLRSVVSSFRAACGAWVVLHSAHERVEVVRILQHAGADGSLEKTDDDAAFVERIRSWVEKPH